MAEIDDPTPEQRSKTLAFLVGGEKSRLACEASGADLEGCPEWHELSWVDVLERLMIGTKLGWVEHFTVASPPSSRPPIKPDLHFCLSARGLRAVNRALREEGFNQEPEGGSSDKTGRAQDQ